MIDATVVLIAISFVLIGWLATQVIALRKRLAAVPKDGDVVKLMSELDEDLARTEAVVADLRPRVVALEEALPSSVSHIGLVAFNAFGNIAGNQSRSIALLDRRGNGIVMSILVGRDETLFFAKKVRAWVSDEELSPEEATAIESAVASNAAQ